MQTMGMVARAFFITVYLSFSIASPAQWRVQSFGVEHGLQGFNFTQVLIDRENRLWVVSTGGIQRFDGQRFRVIVSSTGKLRMVQLRDGRIVYTTSKNELHELRMRNNIRIDSLLARFTVSISGVRDMYEDDTGKLWICSDLGGIYKYTNGDSILQPVIPELCMTSMLPVPGGICFGSTNGVYRWNDRGLTPSALPFRETRMGARDNEGNTWFTAADTLLVMMTEGGEMKKCINLHSFDNKAVINTAPLYDGANGIYLGTTRGLMYYDMLSGCCTWPEWCDEHLHIMQRRAIFSISYVSPGVLWCGTWRGILRIQISTAGISSVPFKLPGNYSSIRLRSVAVASSDTIFAGGGNGSVYRFTRKEESWQTEELLDQPAVHNNAINVIFPDREGGLWLGRNSSMLHVDKSMKHLRSYPLIAIWAIYEDKEGCMWFPANGIIWRLLPGADSCEKIPMTTNGAVYNIWVENDVLLLATSHGIHYFDMRTLKTDSGRAEYNSLLQLTDDCCWSVCRDGKGRYCIGAQFDGLLRFDPRTGRREKLSDGGSVYAVVCDSADQCWAITGTGLLQAGGGRQVPRFYDERDGLLSSEISFVGIRLMPDNAIVTVGDDGLTIIRPGELHRDRTPAPVLIDHIEASGQLLAEDLANEATVTISYREQGINIHLCMPDARFPERYKYRYRIDDDSTWSAWSETPVLSFASFSAGKYRLYFEVQHIDGYYPGGMALNIVVSPPFWQTGFFYAAMAMVVIVFLVIGIGWRIRSLQRSHQAEQVLLELQNKALRAQMNPHFIFNSLNSIQEFILDHQSKEANLYLGKFSMMMRRIIEYSRRSTIMLKEEIEFLKLYLELEQLRFENRFTFRFVASEDLETERVPSMIVQPIVENAIKHGLAGIDRPGSITISFMMHNNNKILCVVEDNGRGRAKAKQHQRASTQHESIGIENIIERLTILSPRKASQPMVTITDLYDEDRNSAGTRVEIFIPLT